MNENKPKSFSTLEALLKRVNTDKPKPKDVRAFRALLDQNPGLWRSVGNVAVQTQHALIQSGTLSAAVRESLKYGIRQLEEELRQPGDGALEALLIDQVILSWLRLNFIESAYTHALKERFEQSTGEFWDGHLAQAQARYLRACEMLARIRKLARPGALQVNIGDRQINVAQVPAAPKLTDDSTTEDESSDRTGG